MGSNGSFMINRHLSSTTPENYLRKCIESLLNQTCTDIEIVLVNDGSTNNSGEVCDEFCCFTF